MGNSSQATERVSLTWRVFDTTGTQSSSIILDEEPHLGVLIVALLSESGLVSPVPRVRFPRGLTFDLIVDRCHNLDDNGQRQLNE